jgi:Protein of unknown function (DUF3429)
MKGHFALISPSPVSLPPLILGVSGLVPFIGLAALTGLGPQTWYAYWLVALSYYGAVILSFVGALHWAYALKGNAHGRDAWIRYAFSVAPALIAWLSLLFPVWTALKLQAAGLLICLLFDRRMSRLDPLPMWFFRLRVALTVVAATSLITASAV